MDKLERLVKEEGAYQPVVVNGEVITKGWRQTKGRWDQIKPHLSDGQTVIDIGSHYGYFTYEIASAFPNSFVWSVESGSKRAEIQKMMLSANLLPNVVLSQHTWTDRTASKLLSTCFTADVILCLSVAHYFPQAKISKMIDQFSQLASTLIIEFPSKQERDVAARHVVQNTDILPLLNRYYEKVEAIGEGTSPKHFDVGRTLYKCSNERINRMGKSYIGSPSFRTHPVQWQMNRWFIDHELRKFPGMTLDDLRHFGMVYPNIDIILRQAADQYDDLIQLRAGSVTDIHIRNVIFGAGELHIIDYDEGVGQTIYDMPWENYVQRTLDRQQSGYHFKEFKQMWKGTWKP